MDGMFLTFYFQNCLIKKTATSRFNASVSSIPLIDIICPIVYSKVIVYKDCASDDDIQQNCTWITPQWLSQVPGVPSRDEICFINGLSFGWRLI